MIYSYIHVIIIIRSYIILLCNYCDFTVTTINIYNYKLNKYEKYI